MKIGIISFAHLHAHSYANALKKMKDVELAGIADTDTERGEAVAAQYGTAFYTDYRKLLEEDIDAVIVTSENSNHHEHVIAAAKAGKHILCEKPLAISVEQGEEMIEICRQHGVALQTAFPVRFNSSIIRAKHMIDEGQLGRILAVKGMNRGVNPGGWFNDVEQAGGGAVMDHTVHVVDIMRWIMKSEIKEVYAEIDQMVSGAPIDDCGILTFEFDNDVFATLDCSWSRNKEYPTWGDVVIEFIGTEGTMKVNAFGQKLDAYTNEKGTEWIYWGDDMDEGLIEDFVTTVRTGGEPSITGEDGLWALKAALAAYRASMEQAPVQIN